MYTIDLDVGGTFTDGFFSDGQTYQTAKVPTTAHDVSTCVLECVAAGAAALGTDLRGLLSEASVFRLSTTIGTNIIVQGRGAKAGLLVSAGAEDDLYGDGPANVITRGFIRPEMVTGIGGAIDETGVEARPLDPDEVLAAVRELVNQGARIIGVCLRNAWRNDAHESRVREIIHERYPVHYLRSVPLQISSEVSPVSNDHARANSLIVNEMLHREMTRSLYDLEDRLRDAGYRWPLLVTHASGGCARIAKTVAAETLQSGPAAAVLGAWRVAQLTGAEHVIAADMGGTSLDVAFASAEQPPWDPRPTVEDVSLAIPMLSVESIGAGGGSIARVDEAGTLSVGPDSAAAYPGPACYGRGGTEATVTDADLILGYIGPRPSPRGTDTARSGGGSGGHRRTNRCSGWGDVACRGSDGEGDGRQRDGGCHPARHVEPSTWPGGALPCSRSAAQARCMRLRSRSSLASGVCSRSPSALFSAPSGRARPT